MSKKPFHSILFSKSGQVGPGAIIMSAAGLVALTFLMQGILNSKKFSASVQSDSEFTTLANSVQNVLNLTKCEGLFKGDNGADVMWSTVAAPIDLNNCQPSDNQCQPSNTTQKYNAQIKTINATKSGSPVAQEGQKIGQLNILKIALAEERAENETAPVAVIDSKDGKSKKTYSAKLQLIGRKGAVPRLKEYYISITTDASDPAATQEKILSCGGTFTSDAKAISTELKSDIEKLCTDLGGNFSNNQCTRPGSSIGGAPNKLKVFSTPGKSTWLVPAGAIGQMAVVEVWGAGGSGSQLGGGQGGSYSKKIIKLDMPIYEVFVGKNIVTSDGEASIFGENLVVAMGGAPGPTATYVQLGYQAAQPRRVSKPETSIGDNIISGQLGQVATSNTTADSPDKQLDGGSAASGGAGGRSGYTYAVYRNTGVIYCSDGVAPGGGGGGFYLTPISPCNGADGRVVISFYEDPNITASTNMPKCDTSSQLGVRAGKVVCIKNYNLACGTSPSPAGDRNPYAYCDLNDSRIRCDDTGSGNNHGVSLVTRADGALGCYAWEAAKNYGGQGCSLNCEKIVPGI